MACGQSPAGAEPAGGVLQEQLQCCCCCLKEDSSQSNEEVSDGRSSPDMIKAWWMVSSAGKLDSNVLSRVKPLTRPHQMVCYTDTSEKSLLDTVWNKGCRDWMNHPSVNIYQPIRTINQIYWSQLEKSVGVVFCLSIHANLFSRLSHTPNIRPRQ